MSKRKIIIDEQLKTESKPAKRKMKRSAAGQEKLSGITEDPVNNPDVISNIESHIYELVDKYINTLDDPEQIYNNNGLFIDMLKYIYKYYVSILLDNNRSGHKEYDYNILDNLFNIYCSLVYKYKKNNQPYINEFCIFTHLDRTILYNIRMGFIKKATLTDVSNVKRWFTECEQGLLNTDSVGSIFRLKSMFNYNDNLAPIPIELQNQVLNAAQLPDLSAKNDKKLLDDPNNKT